MFAYPPTDRAAAAWITVEKPDGTIEYYELDAQGGLVLTNGRVVPHHVCWAESSTNADVDLFLSWSSDNWDPSSDYWGD
jgi:hypothetical protein